MLKVHKTRNITKEFLVLAVFMMVAIAIILPIVRAGFANAAGEGLSTATNKTVEVGQPVAVTDLKVTGPDNETLSLAVHATSGKINYGTQAATVTGSNTSSTVLRGTQTQINSTLATMTVAASTVGTATVTAELGNNVGNVIINDRQGGNGHAYIIVPTNMTWDQARTAAQTYTFGGKTGYLATITSQNENDFIWDHLQGNGWIGASDAAQEGDWRWVTGPEAGTAFWSGNQAGHSVGGQYANWESSIEPNNSMNNENCGLFWNHGDWNDLNCTSLRPFVVEFGDAGRPIETIKSTFTVQSTAGTPPVITQFSPAVGATNVAVDTSLSFTFNKSTLSGEGSFSLYDQKGEEVKEFLNYEGYSDLQQSGNTVTVHPSSNLAPCTTYYLAIGDDIFYHNDGVGLRYFAGVESPRGWYFTTACNGTVQPPNNGDGNADGIPDALQDNVTTIVSPVTSKYVTLATDESCDLSNVSIADTKDFSAKDAGYNYNSGFVQFTASGCDDGVAHIKLYYHGASTSGVVVRKYNPQNNSYFTISEATVTVAQAPLTGALVSYTVTDGGVLDVDGAKNGTIVDPVGLGSLTVSSPNTGIKRTSLFPLISLW